MTTCINCSMQRKPLEPKFLLMTEGSRCGAMSSLPENRATLPIHPWKHLVKFGCSTCHFVRIVSDLIVCLAATSELFEPIPLLIPHVIPRFLFLPPSAFVRIRARHPFGCPTLGRSYYGKHLIQSYDTVSKSPPSTHARVQSCLLYTSPSPRD